MLSDFDRIAMVDVQPHYFGGLIDRVDLVIDHHPEQPGYTAVFKDIRADYGSTCTILTEHLRAVDVNISERTATAMLYAIKSDTLFFNRQTNRVDIEAFSYLYPLADAALIRKMEGAEITAERLDYVMRAHQNGRARSTRCSARSSAPSPREDFIPYVADFFLQLEDVKWTVIAGVVERLAGRLGPEPRLHEERRRVRRGGTSPTSAAPAATAPWPRPSCRSTPSARSSRWPDGSRDSAGLRAAVPPRATSECSAVANRRRHELYVQSDVSR